MFFSGRSKSIAISPDTELRLTHYRRLSSFFSWSLHVYKGSNVEIGVIYFGFICCIFWETSVFWN